MSALWLIACAMAAPQGAASTESGAMSAIPIKFT